MRSHLGQHIRAARTGVHLTQWELAKRAEISVRYIGLLERGTKSPTCDMLWSLIQALRRAGAPLTMDSLFPPLAQLGVVGRPVPEPSEPLPESTEEGGESQ